MLPNCIAGCSANFDLFSQIEELKSSLCTLKLVTDFRQALSIVWFYSSRSTKMNGETQNRGQLCSLGNDLLIDSLRQRPWILIHCRASSEQVVRLQKLIELATYICLLQLATHTCCWLVVSSNSNHKSHATRTGRQNGSYLSLPYTMKACISLVFE